MHVESLLGDLAIVFLTGVLAVLGLARVGLPPVVGFLAAGLLIGPYSLGLVGDPHTIEVVAELGVALLLFTIGLEFSFDRLKRIGRIVAVGGTLQVGLTVLAAVVVAWLLGGSVREGVFWGYLAALSSTAIVLRALADRGETNAPHGRLVVGVLIFQDLCIVPMMLTLPLLAGTGGDGSSLAWVLGKAAIVVVGVVAAARVVVPRLLGHAARARSREVFVLTVLLVAAAVAWATSSMGLSIALGAFLAGVVVAETEFVHQVLSDVSPFRDALASLFFVSVGMLLDPAVLIAHPLLVGGIVLLLVVGKLGVAALAVLLMRFPARVALLSGVALAQVGEFSFVLLRAGEELGLVKGEAGAAFLAASVVTMMVTPVLLGWSPRLAAGARLLWPLERLLKVRPEAAEAVEEARPLRDHVVVAGLGHGGRTLILGLEAAGVPYVGLELNPETVIAARNAGQNVRYGDVTSVEVLEQVAHVHHARQVVLLLSDVAAAARAAAAVRARYPDVAVLVRVHRLERDAATVQVPGVQVIAEDAEAAIEIVERVLRGSGVQSALLASAVAAARSTRDSDGAPAVDPSGLVGAFNMQAVTLGGDDRAVGQSLAGLHLRANTGALVVAHARRGVVHPSPSARAVLEAGDTLFLVGTNEQLVAALDQLARGEAAAPHATTAELPPPPVVAEVQRPAAWYPALTGLALPFGVTGVLAVLNAATGVPALALYGAATGFAGVVGGWGPALVAATTSFVLANVTFIEPVGELTLDARILPLAVLCAASALAGLMIRGRTITAGP